MDSSSSPPRKPFKRARHNDNMPNFLARPTFTSHTLHRNTKEISDFLSSDIEIDLESSFASNVSLNSPPRDDHVLLTPDTEDGPSAMDISPCPPRKVPFGRPRASTSAARLFGRDKSNDAADTSGGSIFDDDTSKPLPNSHSSGNNASTLGKKQLGRGALPMQWHMPPSKPMDSKFPPPLVSPISEDVDAMDVDSDSISFSPAPLSAAPTITTLSQNQLYEDASPRHLQESPAISYGLKKKPRRSLSPDSSGSIRSVRHTEALDGDASSPLHESSPLERKLRRQASGSLLSRFTSAGAVPKPMLQGLGAPNALKRPRRPALSAMTSPSEGAHPNSATVLPTLNANEPLSAVPPRLPARRAFSAMLPPSQLKHMMDESFGSEDSSFEGGIDASSPAQAYAKRQHIKTIKRCDGTEDFRPMAGVTALVEQDRSAGSIHADRSTEMSPATKQLRSTGLPGFGDNESSGKILPCHRVREDGLMRITPQTLNDLIDNKFSSCIREYLVIDCRFDYEYNGGHVPGAVNVRSTSALEDLLLGDDLAKPKPSVSGDSASKTVLVFHCEFSAKRAPTFAKHLRSKDRAMNGHVYPKIHYPEVYILEGGYCNYFSSCSQRCQPPAYVRMDDPEHGEACKQEMDNFRKVDGKEGVGKASGMTRGKFGRHRSYAYGELGTASSQSSFARPTNTLMEAQEVHVSKKRNTAPSGVNGGGSLFAAANAARGRRGGAKDGILNTLQEHETALHAGDTTDEEPDIGDSPCPPPTKASMFKNKRLSERSSRGPLTRAETYGPTRMTR